MAKTQFTLFGEEVPLPPDSTGLLLRPQAGRPLSKAQQTFNRLVARIEKLRGRLSAETRRLDDTLAFYGEHIHPRLQRLNALRKELVRGLEPFLGQGRLKKGERKTLEMMLGEQLDAIARHDGGLNDGDLRALFEQIHRISFEDAEKEGIDGFRSAMEDMFEEFGFEVDFSGLRPGMSEAELAAETARMAERLHQQAQEEEQNAQPPHRPHHPKSKRQMQREQRERQAEEARKKSIATIYKQLARVLHPDFEQDAARKEEKVVLMQELTAAYRNNDLHTLLRLELEWIKREQGDVQRLTDEKLAIYNQVLRDQAWELEREVSDLAFHPRYQTLARLGKPWDLRLRGVGHAHAHELDGVIALIEEEVGKLKGGGSISEIRAAIRLYRVECQPGY